MPRLNGIDACAMWRQIESGRQHLPIVGVTADATAETEAKCKNAGMDLRITKPVDAKLLLATIARLCGDGTEETQLAAPSVEIYDPLNVVVSISGAAGDGPPAINMAQLDYLMSIGDTIFVQSMVEGFLEDVEQTVGPLRKSVDNGNVREFRFCAHAFKSSGNNMGAKRLADLCGRLEKVTEADFAEHRFVYLDKIESELEKAVDALQIIMSNNEGAASAA
jgi:two-component system, sensor histidine kinase RpfC